MAKVQWRPEPNVLTTPHSYRARPVPHNSLGYDELALAIAKKNPLLSVELIKSVLLAMREEIKQQLINGNQVCLENTCVWNLSLSVRLDSHDDPLPPAKEIVKVQINPSRTLLEEVRQAVRLERLPPAEKAPVISMTEDTVLQLRDVLNPDGVLRLTGTGLFFDPKESYGECVIHGTRSGWTAQSRFVRISNSAVFVMPDIPPQSDPWNNEYQVSVSTRYTKHGNMRTGTCERLLRSPLAVPGLGQPQPPETGILTGKAASPHVVITGGSLTAESAQLRIQVMLDARSGTLLLSLVDMREDGGSVGPAVRISGGGPVTLPGFAGSALTSLDLDVRDYDGLLKIVRADYGGRLVDVLRLSLS
jgi:hypothetical protein